MSNLTETLDDAARILHQRFKAQDDRIEKMEKALSEEMAKVREMDVILAGVVKRVGSVSEEPKGATPDPGVAHIASTGWFGEVPFYIAIDPKASPSGIPFSIALEFLKAGRKVRRPGFAPNWCWRISTDDIISPEGVTIHPQSKDVLATDWVVVPEPQNP